ncbi:uncharacterized protein LOC143532225 [Bidens hawaiensis]|uniref:uncharacterized protein LOC143532225 n=1 Tax=Bidens hawaiensis TaxID=980011 RepID=UPI004049EEF6
MAVKDQDKTAFRTNNGTYCYKMMSFGLKNAGSTYQRLMDKEFKSQIGRNLEVYMDDLVIKSKTEIAMLKDVEKTFKILRSISMKLNPGKCSFGMEEGKFLGVIVTNGGFKAYPEKLEAVLKMPSQKPVKQVKTLNSRLVALNRFLSSHAERFFPFVSTLRNCLKKSQFLWTEEAETAFQEIKSRLAELPTLTAPKAGEPLVVYLAASERTVSAVLMVERNGVQTPIYYVSRTLADEETRYSTLEKLVLFLVQTARRLRRYFQGAGAGLRITNPQGQHFTYAIRLEFNNEAEYEALLAGLRIAKKLGAQHLEAHVDSMLVANQIEGSYDAKDDKMASYLAQAKALMAAFTTCKVKHIKWSENKQADALSKLASVGFEHLAKDVRIEVLATPSTMNEEVYVCSMAETNWMTPIVTYLARATTKRNLRINIQRWLKELNITQTFTSVVHPQGNGDVECANRAIVGGIKKRLANYKSGWVDQVPHVLWAIRTQRSTSNAETPFSLTYGTKAMIPAEVGVPSPRITLPKDNEAERRLDLMLLEKRRELAAIREQNYKSQLQKYYNAKVKVCEFNAGDYVLLNNEASRAHAQGKLALSWEGPYQIKEVLGKGAYALMQLDGSPIPRTWNAAQLRRCYM